MKGFWILYRNRLFREDESWYRASVVPMREIIQAVKSVKSGDASIIQPT